FICASDRQRKFYLGMLAACGRINPYNKEKDLIGIVPYGVKEGKPIGKEKILRKLIPEEKKIILWMSSFYSWLDPLKVIEIIYELNKIKDEYALAVVGAKSPFLHQSHYIKRYDEFMDSAKKKDLLGKSIYVLDWIEHDKIPSIYNESDMFIAAHFQSLETELSYRVRMTEALFGRLPIICDGGDVVSDMVKENKLGMVIEGSSPKETAKMIAEITEKDKLQFRKNIEKFIKTQTWDSLITPLDVFCKNPFKDDSKIRFLPDRLIDDRREIMLMQRKIIDEKEGIIRDLEKGIIESNSKFKNQTDMQDREIKKLNDLISDINSDNLVLTDKLSNSQHIIEEMTASNKAIASELIEVKNSLFDAKCKNIELGETITKQRMFIGKFRASIVFSLYKLTSTVGETRIGQILQKILK
ncbi:MAG: glycosyltransferase, partial [Candidatus Woesearchaeota archaeon]|nr:glycosyltransferase [Candidatus Woesearchaeota archaeon]